MNNKEMVSRTDLQRRKFVLRFSILSAFAGFSTILKLALFNTRNWDRVKPQKTRRTVKMLTQDGKLVEVDAAMVSSKRKISNSELQNWVKK